MLSLVGERTVVNIDGYPPGTPPADVVPEFPPNRVRQRRSPSLLAGKPGFLGAQDELARLPVGAPQ
jgi:hypothetical protein